MKDNLKKRFYLFHGLCFFGVIFAYIGGFYVGTKEPLLWIGLAMIAIAFIIGFTLRCPHCGYGLTGRSVWLPPKHHCPNCGKRLHDNDEEYNYE